VQGKDVIVLQRELEADSDAEANYHGPRRRVLGEYLDTLDSMHLDAYVYPAIQMPPVDETMPQESRVSEGRTARQVGSTCWVSPRSLSSAAFTRAAYHSVSSFPQDHGTTEIYSELHTPGSRQHITAARRFSSSRVC
jgi:hypothetical protein